MEYLNVEVATAGVPNKNGRTYPLETLKSVVRQYVGKKSLFGELGMPTNTNVDLERVSHMVTGMRIEDNALLADIRVMTTPMGKVLKQLIEGGCKINYHLAGVGEVSPDGVVTDYKFISVNAVKNGA